MYQDTTSDHCSQEYPRHPVMQEGQADRFHQAKQRLLYLIWIERSRAVVFDQMGWLNRELRPFPWERGWMYLPVQEWLNQRDPVWGRKKHPVLVWRYL